MVRKIIKIDEEKCTKCGLCQKACKLDIPVYRKPNSPECIRCGDCKKACPHGAVCSSLSKKRPSASVDDQTKEKGEETPHAD